MTFVLKRVDRWCLSWRTSQSLPVKKQLDEYRAKAGDACRDFILLSLATVFPDRKAVEVEGTWRIKSYQELHDVLFQLKERSVCRLMTGHWLRTMVRLSRTCMTCPAVGFRVEKAVSYCRRKQGDRRKIADKGLAG